MQYKQNIPKGFLQLSLPFFFFGCDCGRSGEEEDKSTGIWFMYLVLLHQYSDKLK